MHKKTVYLLALILALVGLVIVLLYFLGPQGKNFGPKINSRGLSATPQAQEQAGSVGEVTVKNPTTGETEPLKTATIPRLSLTPAERLPSFTLME